LKGAKCFYHQVPKSNDRYFTDRKQGTS